MSTGTTALLIGDLAQAEAEARHALALLGQRPQEEQSAHVRASAVPDLAHARLLADDVDGVAESNAQDLWISTGRTPRAYLPDDPLTDIV
ncbi:hypothetical protein [Streptomyces colonosanans]|nr:hypothetical protein [Streptomyces colonosanans]